MSAYLTDNEPARDQWYERRNRPLTGCTVLHTTESVFDEMGEDTGAEGVANFIRTRSTPGSYHDLVDSDSQIHLVEYVHGAYHDGTGSNNWALAVAWACRTVDWARMSPAKRKAMLRNGAQAAVRQQAYRRSIGAPLTEPRLITKAQSDAGMSGFTYHGYRDPGRRTDPGTTAAAPFPIDEFLAEYRAALAGGTTTPPQEDDDMPGPICIRSDPSITGADKGDGSVFAVHGDRAVPIRSGRTYSSYTAAGVKTINMSKSEFAEHLRYLDTEETEMPKLPGQPA